MNRTGSIASRVPPAVTTMWRPSRSASTRRGHDRRTGGGIGGPDRPIGDGRDHGIDDRLGLREAADAGLARTPADHRRAATIV